MKLSDSTSEAMLSSILEIAADAIIAIDSDQRICLFSQAAERTFGYRAEEALGRPLDLILPTWAAAKHGAHIHGLVLEDAIRRPMTERLPVAGRRKDGTEFPAEVGIAKLAVPGQSSMLVAILHDVSRRRRTEDELHESRERYYSIVAVMEEGILQHDAEGRIITWNASAERILGRNDKQMTGGTCLDLYEQAIHGDGSPFPAETHPVMVTLRTGQPQFNIIMGIHKPGGDLTWLSINCQPQFRPGEAAPYAAVASITDVTQSRQAEQALRESEARYRSLVENNIEGVLLTTHDGAILAANPEACRLLGRSEAELREMGGANIFDPTDPRLADALAERTRTGRVRKELTFLRQDGTPFPVEMSSGLFRAENGEVRSSIVFRDISERIHSYQWLEHRVTERTSAITALLEVSRHAVSGVDLRSLFSIILTQLKKVVDYAGAGIAIVEDGELRILSYRGTIAREKMLNRAIPLDRDSGYLQVITRQEPVIIRDCWADTPWMSGVRASFSGETLDLVAAAQGWLGVPVRCDEDPIGLLWLEHGQPGFLTEDHARLAIGFAEMAALAIRSERLNQRALQVTALEERQKLARDLHDSVSQALYCVVLGARTGQAQVESRDPVQAQQALDFVLSQAEVAFANMRELIFEYRPDALDTEGLIPAIIRQIDDLRGRHAMIVEADLPKEPVVPLDIKEVLYRITQETFNNIVKHAHARHVKLRLGSSPTGVALEISDDGQGFRASETPPGHLGMRTMEERATGAGGTFKIESLPGQGTRIRVWIPSDPLWVARRPRGAK